MKRIARIFFAGLLALLPLLVTLFVLGWVINLAAEFVGPGSTIGGLLSALGISTGSSETVSYLIGLLITLAAIFLLGLLIDTHVWSWASAAFERLILKIPVAGSIYGLSKRFVGLVDTKGNDGIKNMSAVWCFFGGEPGAAVLALLPSTAPVRLGNVDYLGVLLPTAPVPVGGGLIYVPSSWVKPADIGVEQLMSVYVSMGVTPPEPGKKSERA